MNTTRRELFKRAVAGPLMAGVAVERSSVLLCPEMMALWRTDFERRLERAVLHGTPIEKPCGLAKMVGIEVSKRFCRVRA